MSPTIKSVFDQECSHLVFDKQFIKKLSIYRTSFEMKNEDHITFFGGNLTGVQVVKFFPEDRDNWFEYILELNEFVLKDALEDLPSIDTSRVVTSDTMNLSFIWVMYKLFNSKSLSNKEKEDSMIDVAMIMQFKFLTSRYNRHFKYPADVSIAAATYAQLNYKFAIKQHGNWKEVLLARSRDIISKSGIHYKAITTMEPDSSVLYVLSDSQGRIRDMLKNIYDVHLRVKNNNTRIVSTSSTIEHDGEMILKDVTKSLTAYNRYIHSIITDKRSFIRSDLTQVIEKLIHTMSPRMFQKTLEWVSLNYRQSSAGFIETAINDLMLYSLDYLKLNKTMRNSGGDLAVMLTKLRGSFMSSRNTDPQLMRVKSEFEKMVTNATGSKHPGIVGSVRTGVMLYIVARALTMKYYSTAAIIN